MKTKLFLFFSVSIFSLNLIASDNKYAIANIPKEMLEDAKAVVRKNDVVFEISDPNSAVAKVNYAITILNKNGLSLSLFREVYNKFSSVKKIKMTVYDANGKIIHIGSSTVLRDIAAFDGYSLYDDYRIKLFDPEYATVPFTVEYSFEFNFYGLLNYPDWVPYIDYNVSTEKSDFTVITPQKIKINYLEQHLKDSCIRKLNTEGKFQYMWSISNLPAIRKEPFCQALQEFTPAVFLSPDEFEIAGYSGNCGTWKNFGLWLSKLAENSRHLNTQTQEKIKSLVSKAASDSEKVRILYKFLQNKVRYVSVQEGIGGWQPIDAESVDRVSYGDCKALANYMKSILSVAGIKSYYTIIKAGEDAAPIRRDFPSNQFNHAIVCVPLVNDTIWLECTDQLIPFGFLGSFTDDRKALIIDSVGGTIVNTRVYSVKDNMQIRSGIIKVNADGTADASINTIYKGLKYDDIFGILRMDDADKNKYLKEKLSIPSFELVSFKYSEIKDRIPSIIEDLSLGIRDYGSVSGQKMVFYPNILTRNSVPLVTKKRRSPVLVRRSYHEYDSITYVLPSGFRADSKPIEYHLNSDFGDYSYRCFPIDNKLIYIRSLKLFKGLFETSRYTDLIDFLEKIETADSRQVALTKL
jgi:hypothetical protein